VAEADPVKLYSLPQVHPPYDPIARLYSLPSLAVRGRTLPWSDRAA